MKQSNVKRADAVVNFDYQGQEIKLGIREINFYNRYYYSGSDTEIKIINNETTSLTDELKLPFFNKALELISTFKIKNNSCGRLYLHLLDDACLPIIYTTETVELGCSQQELKD